MINKVILAGRLVKDPELRKTQTDISVCSFTIAVNRPFTSKDGQRGVDFIDCVAWRNQAENLAQYMRKGSLIAVEGRLQTRVSEYEGQKRKYFEIQCDNVSFLESKGASNSGDDFQTVVEEEEDFEKDITVKKKDLPF